MVTQIEDRQLEEYVKTHEIVVLDIFTTWCGPCTTQAAILTGLESEVDSKRVSIIKMDADQCPTTCQRFGVTAIPTVVLFKEGKVVTNHVGVWSKADLLREIEALL
ncbi:MAG: thioredoxin family protein [Promethearchaeota archaeon]